MLSKTSDEKILHPFSNEALEQYLSRQHQEMHAKIEEIARDQILGANETDFIQYLISKYKIDTPIIDFDNRHGEWREDDVLTDYEFVIAYHLPLKGDYRFLEYCPGDPTDEEATRHILYKPRFLPGCRCKIFVRIIQYFRTYSGWGNLSKKDIEQKLNELDRRLGLPLTDEDRIGTMTEVEEYKKALEDLGTLASSYLYFEIISKEGSGKKTEDEARKMFNAFRSSAKQLAQQIEKYNKEVEHLAPKLFYERKKRIIRNDKILVALKLPIKIREDLPSTYAIPTPQFRKSVTVMPPVADKLYVPEPTLHQKVYHDILQTIYDVGKVFERLPATYKDKCEKDLRDHFLLYLEPRYEGSATGETFNGDGQTDILIRHANSNVFVAECKFWDGSKAYLDTITQLLTYVRWRDSKAAIIIFARTKGISSVLQDIKEATPQHPNYLDFVDEEKEAWHNYRFHINNDRNREVKLAVLVFHFPRTRNLQLPVVSNDEMEDVS